VNEQLIRQLLASCEGLRLELALSRRPASMNADSAQARLLRAIYAAFADGNFTASQLKEFAELPVDGERLRDAMVTAVGSLEPKAVGRTLSAWRGLELSGLTVQLLAEERDGKLWKVAPVAG
jgi:hypothetical protein